MGSFFLTHDTCKIDRKEVRVYNRYSDSEYF